MHDKALIHKGFLFALASTALFAVRPIFVKLAYIEQLTPLSLLMWRMLFSAPVYLFILVLLIRDADLRSRITRKNVLFSSLTGLFGYYFASYFDLIGLQYVSAQLGRIVLYAYPTLVVLLSVLFLRQRITLSTVTALIITYTGILVIFGHDLGEFGSDVVRGSLWILACALSFAIYMLMAKPMIQELGSRLFTSIALISASLAIYVHFGIQFATTAEPESLWPMSTLGLIWVFVIAIFCTVIPTFFTTAALGRIGPEKTGIVAMVGPGFTSVFAVWVLNESFTAFHLLGILLSVFGVWHLHKDSVAR